jgi:SAM-dependent methyltransferase
MLNTDEQAKAIDSPEHWLEILRHNQGFDKPEDWIDYAIEHNFDKVEAIKIDKCPSCSGVPNKRVGQLVYYSQLMSLRICKKCGLYYVDARLNHDLIASHFEFVYKDANYFLIERSPIFAQVIDLIKRNLSGSTSGRMLDVGGATGVFAQMAQQTFPEFEIVVSDISRKACDEASKKGFRVLRMPLEKLENVDELFDVVTVLDTIYYVEDLNRAFKALTSITKINGLLFMRLPARTIPYTISRLREICGLNTHADRIRRFNPEHLYYLPWHYLKFALKKAGFYDIRRIASKTRNAAENQRFGLNRYLEYPLRRIKILMQETPPTATAMIVICRRNE